jgi:hypothetical protein
MDSISAVTEMSPGAGENYGAAGVVTVKEALYSALRKAHNGLVIVAFTFFPAILRMFEVSKVMVSAPTNPVIAT